ncbi:MAG: Replication factor C small subunit [Candidatus Bathyarchaeota archaeon BA1]|nr:MAG: Replication factor C small subunit [Candidatus Bathyarchaeota archaeon BA1]
MFAGPKPVYEDPFYNYKSVRIRNNKITKIGINELSSNFYVYLEESFRKKLFEQAIYVLGDEKALARLLGVCIDTITILKRGRYFGGREFDKAFMNVKFLRKMLKLTNVSISEVESSVTLLRGKSGRVFRISLPIRVNENIASLLGHSFGDGGIDHDFAFKYVNKEPRLLERVQAATKSIFNDIEAKVYFKANMGELRYEYKYPAVVGHILHILGAPVGSKVKQEIDIPKWLFLSSKTIRTSFIRSIYDDESTVNVSGKSIHTGFSRLTSLKGFLIKFLTSLKMLLRTLTIVTSEIFFMQKYQDKLDEERTKYGFCISSYENLEKFQREIGFFHPQKQERLGDSLRNYTSIGIQLKDQQTVKGHKKRS